METVQTNDPQGAPASPTSNPVAPPAQQPPAQKPPSVATMQSPSKEKIAVDIINRNQQFKDSFGTILAQKAANPYSDMENFSFDPKSTTNLNQNFERFYSHGAYKNLGFNPWRNNDAIYTQNGTAMADVWRATKAAGHMAIQTFFTPLASYGDVFSGNAGKLDDESAKQMSYYTAVGSSSKGGATGFISNLTVNMGFTVGLMGEFFAEQALLSLATAETGGAGAGVQAIRAMKTAKTWGQYLDIAKSFGQAAEKLKNFDAAKTAYDSFQKFGKFVNPLEHTFEALNSSKNLTALAKNTNTAAGFYRDVSSANFVLAEAKIEGASAKQDTEQKLISDWKAANQGLPPSLDELVRIKEAAKTAGDNVLALNIPAIFLTNKITFAPWFKPFEKTASAGVLRGGVKYAVKEGQMVRLGMLGSMKEAFKPKNLLGSTLTYFKSNLSEGIQESVQEVIQDGAKHYYTGIYDTAAMKGLTFGQAENLGQQDGWESLGVGIKSQGSAKGFEVFASGFLMGGLVGIARAPIQMARMGVAEYKKEKSLYAQRVFDSGNTLLKDPLTFFSPKSMNFSATATGASALSQEEATNNRKGYFDIKDHNTVSHIVTALNTGSYDVVLDQLRSIKTMTPQAIKDAWGYDPAKVYSNIDGIIKNAERIKEAHAKWNEIAPNPFNPQAFKKDSPEYVQEAVRYVAWENARNVAIFQDNSFVRNVDRISDMGQSLQKIPGFKDLSANDVNIVQDPVAMQNEISLLTDEIEILKEDLGPNSKVELKQKREKLKYLMSLHDSLRGHYFSSAFDNATEEQRKVEGFDEAVGSFKKAGRERIKSAYSAYIKHLANTQGTTTDKFDEDINKSFETIMDIHDLKQENVHLARAINVLSNPEKFADQYKRLHKVFSDLYENRSEIIKKSIEYAHTKIEDNAVLKALFDRGFVLSPEQTDALLSKKEVPSEFYDTNAKEVVDGRDGDRFSQFEQIIKPYLDVTKPEEKPATPEQLKAFAERIAKGEDMSADVDIEFHKTNKVAVEAELAKMAKKEEAPAAKEEKGKKKIDFMVAERFATVKTGEELEQLVNDLYAEMNKYPWHEYHQELRRVGLLSEVIAALEKEKAFELQLSVTYENLKPGDVVAMVAPGKSNAIVLAPTKDSASKRLVRFKYVDDDGIIFTVKDTELKKIVKYKFTEDMKAKKTPTTPEDAQKAKQSAKDQVRLYDNKDLMSELVDEALKNPEQEKKEFLRDLGCK